MNNVNDPSHHGCANPADEHELNPNTCEEYHNNCCFKEVFYYGKWWCEECITLHFRDELDEIIDGRYNQTGADFSNFIEDCSFIAHTDNEDEFSHFVVVMPRFGSDHITLGQLEQKIRENKKIMERRKMEK